MAEKRTCDEGISLVSDALKLKKPKRIPIHSTIEVSYAIQHAGIDYRKASWTPTLYADAMIEALNSYCWDTCDGAFIRPAVLYRMLGSNNFQESSDGYVQHPEVSGMLAEDYDAMIENPFRCIVERVLPRLYNNLNTKNPFKMYNFAKGAFAYDTFFGALGAECARIDESTGVPGIFPVLTEAPFDYLADQLRGFTNICTDMRRNEEKVALAVEAVLPLMVKNAAVSGVGGSDLPGCCIPLHLPPYMNTKQFERFYWPTFKKMVETLADLGITMEIFFENDWERYFDYLQDLPATGKIAGYFEYGSPQKAKDMLGDRMCLMGFYPVTLLGNGTKQQCVDKAKELTDILAPGGGYIFCTDKCIISDSDIKVENLKAVTEFVRENGKY